MKTTSLALLASTVCATLAVAAENDPAARQYQVYPKNLARQHVGSNLFVFNPTNQTYVPTEAAAAWLDDDVTTGWPVLAGKQHYLLALSEPELVSNFSVSARPTDGSISIFSSDEPAAPGTASWTPLAKNVPFNTVNEKKLDKPFTRFAKYILIETDLANPGPLYSLYVYGEKPATIYTMREREQPIDSRAIFGQYVNNQTTFNASGLYAGSSVAYANSPDGSTSWQKAVDDNPGTGVTLGGSNTDASAVIRFGSPQSISRVSLLTDGSAKGKLDFFAIDEVATAASTEASLEGRTPTVSLVLDGSTPRSSIDFPAVNATKLAMRWSPVVPSEPLNVREVDSFGTASLDNYEVGMKSDAIAAYDAAGAGNYSADGKEMKGGKEMKEPIAAGPEEVAAGPQGGPYLPGALGFPPNLSGRKIKGLSGEEELPPGLRR
jgi:hypothetical protein